jgi:hypothetical protein
MRQYMIWKAVEKNNPDYSGTRAYFTRLRPFLTVVEGRKVVGGDGLTKGLMPSLCGLLE